MSSEAVAALYGLCCRIDTALMICVRMVNQRTLGCRTARWATHLRMPHNFPSGRSSVKHKRMSKPRDTHIMNHYHWRCCQNPSDLSRPSPTAIMRLLSPSHSRSLLVRRGCTSYTESGECSNNVHAPRKNLVFPLQCLFLAYCIPDTHCKHTLDEMRRF